ncbi:COG1470 family protein [Chitinophaga rhizosphaerae]|uniref:COG1470 family protein n=1 Tax=Chitinophaga rhizosphaerae TaxID=1864947 RepID=UPI001F0BD34B|nr:NEW3 domain-containing protein [Chitinophaga rhizosphaerae]
MASFSTTAYGQAGKPKGKSTFTVRLMNLESSTKEPFRYSASLKNGSGRTEIYALGAMAPAGWTSIFRVDGSQVAGLRLDSGLTQEISVELTAAPATQPGKYKVPVMAVGENDTLRLELEAVVKGNYGLELSTPTGRLSDDITEGSKKRIEMTVKNTGSLPLEGVELSAQAPVNWSATFEPSKIERLEPGQTKTLTAILNVPDKTIAGDYVTNFTARNDAANSTATFRMTVKTSLLSGWLGILVILLSLGIVYYLIRKYGRR